MAETCAIDFLFDPITLGSLSVTDVTLFMGDGYLQISKSSHLSYKFRKKSCRQICPKWL